MAIARMRSPGRLTIGPGAAAEVGGEAALLGRRALVIGGTRDLDSLRPALLESLDGAGVPYHLEQGAQVRNTLPQVEALIAAGRAFQADVVVACGGGGVMDCAKAVAYGVGGPLVNVPTVATTNACGTPGAVIEGADPAQRARVRAADAIVADTAVIARSGGRYLASGMADAVSTWFGARLALRRGQSSLNPTRLALARLCTDLILEHGEAAFGACQRGEATPEVDQVVEAIIYCSGAARFGMTGDHQLHPAQMPGCRAGLTHGEWVAFGFLVRLTLGGEFAADLPRMWRFFRAVGLPTHLSEFDLGSVTPDQLREEAQRILARTNGSTFGIDHPITPEQIRDAMLAVDHLSA